jgi:hypothetical protein
MTFQSHLVIFRFPYISLLTFKLSAFCLSLILIFSCFSAVESYAEQITFAWDDPHNDPVAVSGYNLYYWQPDWDLPASVDVGTQTTYTLTGLQEGQRYHFAVTAYSHSGNESLFSNEVETTILKPNDPALDEVLLPVFNVTASADDGNVAANTTDGDLSTRWSAYGDGQWIRFDLGTIQAIASVDIAFYAGDLRSSLFDIEVSNDDSIWTKVFSGSSSGTTTEFETFDLTGATGRYVRIVGYGRIGSGWNSITEVTIFGE